MHEEPERTFAINELKVERSPDFRRIYTNYARLAFTPWDVSMTMAVLEERGPKDDPVIIDQAIVTMSPAHFKAFATTVIQNLGKYERQHGEIAVPDVAQSAKD